MVSETALTLDTDQALAAYGPRWSFDVVRRDVGVALLTGAIVGGAVFWAEQASESTRAQQAEILENIRFIREVSLLGDSSDVILDGFDLAGAPLAGMSLQGVQLRDANLVRANLIEAQLQDADLSGSLLNLADLSGADLTRANLASHTESCGGVDLIGARLVRTNLTEADLTCTFLQEVDMRSAILVDARLDSADLTGSDLSEAEVRGASFADAGLFHVNVQGVDFSTADLSGVLLGDVFCDGSTMWPTDLVPPNCRPPSDFQLFPPPIADDDPP